MTQEEFDQLTKMSRPKNKGRLSTHELLSKIILTQQEEIRKLKETVVDLIKSEHSMLNVMNRFMEENDPKKKTRGA